MKRQASRGRLLGIFSRAKSAKAPTSTVDRGFKESSALGQARGTSYNGQQSSSLDGLIDSAAIDSMSGAEPTKRASTKTKRSKSFKKEPSTAKSIPWDPPPLFQAYPQSVKHGSVLAPTVSADVIIRSHADRKRKQGKRGTTSDNAGEEGGSRGDELDELQDMELTQKIFVLVTSGYILQYAGDGSFDRLPEKILAIGQDSAAFASDAVPGKHWVLQLSHALDENASPKLEKTSFVKRLGLRGDVKRYSALNLLLILDNPEDLESWLSTVKREFEAWGGKRYRSDANVSIGGEEVMRTLQQTPSRRYPVKRDPNQFSSNAKEPCIAFDEAIPGVAPATALRKHSTATQNSVHSPSTSNMTTSTDQVLLDHLGSSPEMSYISTEGKTHASSRETSPVPSPTRLAFRLGDLTSNHEQSETAEIPVKATGQYPVQQLPRTPLDHSLPSTLTRPLSIAKASPARTTTGAPNFSVPSFSKRYSSTHSTPPWSRGSSNTSNQSRKPSSTPTITEQHDDLQDIADAAAEASVMEPVDGNALSENAVKHAVPGPSFQASTDRILPRRLSSLEYSRGVSPVHLRSSQALSPHPPPASALPELPESDTDVVSPPGRSLRRPVSMQIHPSSSPSSADVHESLQRQSSEPAKTTNPNVQPPFRDPLTKPMPTEPSLHLSDQRLVPPCKVLNRRSMPHLNRPPSDPPNCPLPTPPVPRLPPIKLSSGSLRRSVERPLRAGLGARSAGLVEPNEG